MTFLTPIPTDRVGNFQIRHRLMNQLQQDQVELLRLQDQVSSGRRLSLPSEDAPAALRGISLQRLLEQKDQIQVNLQTSVSFLGATDASLATVSGMLSDVRAAALGVADTISTHEQRQAVAAQVERALGQLVDTGNQSFRGRPLFAGSRNTPRPYEATGGLVRYVGNERRIQSYSDIDMLSDTNLHGVEVFGGISEPVRTTADLSPHLTPDTLLSSVNGGRGISPNGAISVSDGTSTSVVDLSRAATIEDVARLIEASPPPGRTVSVEITGTGLSLSLDAVGGGNLTVTEVAGGRTARELGIFEDLGALTGPLEGADLDPALLRTTPLSNLLGTKAAALLKVSGANNDLVLQAARNGAELNGVDIQFAAGAFAAGNEYAEYDATAKTLTVFVQGGVSTAQQVVTAINQEGTFTASLDERDALTPAQSGKGIIDLAATAATSGGSGSVLDTESGLQITNGNETFAIDLNGAETVEDLLNRINESGANVLAEINATKTGIDIRSRLSGADFAIGENGGQTAAQLGLRTFTAETRLEDLNRGIGVVGADDAFGASTTDLVIVSNDGTELEIDAASAETVGDVIDLINTHPLNNSGTTSVTARLAEFGNGIELIDTNTNGAGTLSVRTLDLNRTAEFLGLVEAGATENIATGAVAATGVADLASANADLTITASQAAAEFSGASIAITHSGATVGDAANVSYDPTSNTLTIDVDPTATTALTVRDAINGEGTFTAALNTDQGPNDGSGLVVDTGTVATLGQGAPATLTGRDVHPLETKSAFNSLIRLQNALEQGDIEGIHRAIELIDEDILRVNFARSENGARHQGLEVVQTRVEDEQVELKRALSLEIDADLAESISLLTARQLAVQASLRTAATLLQLTILDFI